VANCPNPRHLQWRGRAGFSPASQNTRPVIYTLVGVPSSRTTGLNKTTGLKARSVTFGARQTCTERESWRVNDDEGSESRCRDTDDRFGIVMIGGILLLVPATTPVGSFILSTIMVGALWTHAAQRQWVDMVPVMVLLALFLAVFRSNRSRAVQLLGGV